MPSKEKDAEAFNHTASIQTLFNNFGKQIEAFSKTTDANDADPKCTDKLGKIAEQVQPFIERSYYEARQGGGKEIVAHLDNALKGVFELRMEQLDEQIEKAGKTEDTVKRDFLSKRKKDEVEAQKAISAAASDRAGLLTDDSRMLAAAKLVHLGGTVKEDGSFKYSDKEGDVGPGYFWNAVTLSAKEISDKVTKNIETEDKISKLTEVEVGYVTKDGKDSVQVKYGKFADKKKAARASALMSKEKGWEKVRISGFETAAGKFSDSKKYNIGMRKEMFLAHIEEGFLVSQIIFDVNGKDVAGYEGIAKHLKMSVEDVKQCDERAKQAREGEAKELQSFEGQFKGFLSKKVEGLGSKKIFDQFLNAKLLSERPSEEGAAFTHLKMQDVSAETQAAAVGLVDDIGRYNQLYDRIQASNQRDNPEKRVRVDELLIADWGIVKKLEKAAEDDEDVHKEFGDYLQSQVQSNAGNIADLSKDNANTKARLKPLLEKLKPEILVAICGDEVANLKYADNAQRTLQFMDDAKVQRDFLAKLSPEVLNKIDPKILLASCEKSEGEKTTFVENVQQISSRLSDVARGKFFAELQPEGLKNICGTEGSEGFNNNASLLFNALRLDKNSLDTTDACYAIKRAEFLSVLPQPTVNLLLEDCGKNLKDADGKYKAPETFVYGRILQKLNKISSTKHNEYMSTLSAGNIADTVFARTLVTESVLSRHSPQFLLKPGSSASLNDVQLSVLQKALLEDAKKYSPNDPEGLLGILQALNASGEKAMAVSILALVSKDMAALFEKIINPDSAGKLFKMFLEAKLNGNLPEAKLEDAIPKEGDKDNEKFKECKKVLDAKVDALADSEGKEGLSEEDRGKQTTLVNDLQKQFAKIEEKNEKPMDPASTTDAGVLGLSGGASG